MWLNTASGMLTNYTKKIQYCFPELGHCNCDIDGTEETESDFILSTFTELNRAFIDLRQRDYSISIKAFQEPSQSMNMNILK